MTARILIVDDVPANLRLLQAKLAAEYYQMAGAQDGYEAMDLARRWQPDLILLDVMMPGMDGYECCRRLKADPETLHIPVVMVTALGASPERLLALEAGADDFLTKPVDFGTLVARVRSLVRLKRLLDEWRARASTARALGACAGAGEPISVAGALALVVEDWAPSAEIVMRALAREGIAARHVTSGAEAAGIAAEGGWDLVVLSLSLTADDPLLLAARLRAAEGTQHIPVLLIADQGEPERSLRAFDLGANDWVLQPVDVNELRVRARNQVRRKRYQDRLRADLGEALELAATDPLTGLYNRRYLMRHLASLLDAAAAPHVAVLMLDMDRFKSVNDELGHAAGDQALRMMAATLRETTRAFDTLARIGGEEFVVLMPGTSAAEAVVAAERLRGAVETRWSDRAHCLTVSIGVAATEGAAWAAEHLLAAADEALYEAKRAGRNRVRLGARRLPDPTHVAKSSAT
ncbi:MAG: PleD family two-component system response regulator [Acetobacteraceae bacterium]